MVQGDFDHSYDSPVVVFFSVYFRLNAFIAGFQDSFAAATVAGFHLVKVVAAMVAEILSAAIRTWKGEPNVSGSAAFFTWDTFATHGIIISLQLP